MPIFAWRLAVVYFHLASFSPLALGADLTPASDCGSTQLKNDEQRGSAEVEVVLKRFDNSQPKEFLGALNVAMGEQVDAGVREACGGPCTTIGASKTAVRDQVSRVIAKLSGQLGAIGSRLSEYLPASMRNRRTNVATLLFLSGTIGVTAANSSLIALLKTWNPQLAEGVLPVMNMFTGLVMGATTYLTLDATSSKLRALTGWLAGGAAQQAGTQVRVEPEIGKAALLVWSRQNGIDGRIGGVYGAWNGFVGSTSTALVAARLAGQNGEHAGAYTILAGVALLARKTSLQIDPNVTLPFVQLSPIIATYANTRLPEIYPQVLARIIAIHKIQFDGREPTLDEINQFYRPFLHTLFEPPFTPDQAMIDAIIADNPHLTEPR